MRVSLLMALGFSFAMAGTVVATENPYAEADRIAPAEAVSGSNIFVQVDNKTGKRRAFYLSEVDEAAAKAAENGDQKTYEETMAKAVANAKEVDLKQVAANTRMPDDANKAYIIVGWGSFYYAPVIYLGYTYTLYYTYTTRYSYYDYYDGYRRGYRRGYNDGYYDGYYAGRYSYYSYRYL